MTLLLTLLAAAPATAATNVVIIETDDQRADDIAAMPRTRALIGAEGVEFANSFVSLSECCPSRATLLTGQYAHNHGVRASVPPFGGYLAFDGTETLAVWLRRAGYQTGMVGKYLNGYRGAAVPPGWTDFEGLLGRFTYRFHDYTLNDNGQLDSPARYQTDEITARSLAFIRPRTEPFFLWVNYVAPHIGRPRDLADPRIGSTVPALRHAGAFLGAPLPYTPAFNEADVSDKPPSIRRRLPLKPWRIRALAEIHRQRLAALLAVDEGVGRIVDALSASGELEETLLVFTSDNGFLLGEHRIAKGKVLPYEPSIRVPLLMRGPGLAPGTRRDELVWNGDLAPTILDATGASAPHPLDGHSLLRPRPGGRAILLEGPPRRGTNGMPLFTGLRTERYKYVEYVRGPVELYDLWRDPGELHNLARDAHGLRERLARRLERLRRCAGAGCRG